MRLGRYELLYRLATGGMGEVFLARRRGPGDIEKQVVIKRIRRELSGDPRFVDMFLSEARVSMTLSHKNIVPVFDFGRAGSELFLAMEYVRGRDLARALLAAGDRHRLSPAAVAHIGIEVCRALDYAHHRADPIIHRDLSPKNLLLSFAGEVVVADFGLAIPATGEALDGVRGTPAYLSPEQASGGRLDGRADLFTLGLVLREILSDETAYGAGEPSEIIARARRAELEPLAGDYPEPLVAAINRATRADRDERFDNARAMQLALDQYLIGARAAGAQPPTHELAEWLETLFPDPEVDGEPLAGDRLDAVTFLDDGLEAVDAEAHRLSHAVSVAETIGDSIVEAGPDPDPEPEPKPEPPGSRFWLRASAVGAVLAGVAWGISSLMSGEPAALAVDASVVADASIAVDAFVPGVVDAAPVTDAALVDARPAIAAPEPGVLKVNTTRGWAQVSVPRARARCPETPCTFRLRPGTYTVEIRNPVDDSMTTRDVRISPGETATLVVPL